MADAALTARDPFAGLDAGFEIGDVTAAPYDIGPSLVIAPYRDRLAAASAAVEAAIGAGLPEAGRWIDLGEDRPRLIWHQAESWLCLAGTSELDGLEAALKAGDLAQCRRQEGAWAVMSLRGPAAADLVARLTSLDLREAAFGPGQVAACELAHMPGLVVRGNWGYGLWVPRSYAGTLAGELREGAQRLARRG